MQTTTKIPLKKSIDRVDILLIIFALLMPLTVFLVQIVFVGLIGLIFVVAANVKWGLRLGLLAAVWAALNVLISFYVTGGDPYNLGLSIGIYFIIAVITGRSVDLVRAHQKDLLKSEEQLRDVIESQSEMVARATADGTITFANEAYCHYFGFTREEILGRNFFSFIFEDDRQKFEQYISSLSSQNPVERMEYRVKLPSGEVRWNNWSIRAFFDEEKNLIEYQGVGRDITERKELEKNMRNLVENAPDMIVRFNSKLQHIYCNCAVEEIFGIPGDYLLGKTFEDIANELEDENSLPHLRRMNEVLEKSFQTGVEQEITQAFPLPDGEKHLFTRVVPEKDEEGKVESLLALSRDISDLVAAQEELNQKSAEYETVFHGTQSAMFLVKVEDDGVFRYIRNNEAHQKATGISEEEMRGKTPRELVGDEIGSEIEHNYYYCVRNRVSYFYEESLSLTGGDRIWHTTLTPVVNENNRVTHIVGSSIDITERKKAEQELIEHKNLLEGIIDGIPDVLAIQNPDHSIEMYNQTGYEMLAMTPDEVKGKKCYELLGREEECEICATRKALKSKKLEHVEKYVPEWNVYLDCRSNPILDKEGNIIYVVEHLQDITQRKRHEELLRQSEEKFRAYTEKAPLAIFVADIEGNYIEVNPAACQLLEYEENELLDLSIPDVLDPEHKEKGMKNFDHLIKEGYTSDELLLRSKLGNTFWVSLVGTTIDENRHIAFCEDITERKEKERQIALYNLELEELYSQLNAEIDKTRRIHERTLPTSLPQVKGVSFAAHYQPAVQVGGDFYNVIHAENKLILFLSDVSGHSLEGALFSAFVKEAISSYISMGGELKPAKILEYLDGQYRQENFPEDYFICIYLAVLDLETMEFTYTAAGFQDAPLLRTAEGSMYSLVNEGLPISNILAPNLLNFTEKSLVIRPGDTVLINTDGLTEQLIDEEPYGYRLKDVFDNFAHLPPEAVVHGINQDFRRFNNNSLQGDDDITLLVMQVDSPHKTIYKLELESKLEELERLQQELYEFLSSSEYISHEDIDVYIFAVNELAANAIEHGNRLREDAIVSVEIIDSHDYMYAVVQDEGKGFSWQEKINAPVEMDGEMERGRGIAMASMFCDHLFFNEVGNRAFVVKNKF